MLAGRSDIGSGSRSGVVQVAYLVDDVRAGALAHHSAFGSGPFFVADHIPLADVTHDRRPALFDHSSAYGQWGDVMVELVCIHSAEPSALNDAVSGPVEGGAVVRGLGPLHHVARFVDDIDVEARELEGRGFPQVMVAATRSGQRFAFHDGGPLGHLLEIYRPTPGLLGFYGKVADAAAGWTGDDVVRLI